MKKYNYKKVKYEFSIGNYRNRNFIKAWGQYKYPLKRAIRRYANFQANSCAPFLIGSRYVHSKFWLINVMFGDETETMNLDTREKRAMYGNNIDDIIDGLFETLRSFDNKKSKITD